MSDDLVLALLLVAILGCIALMFVLVILAAFGVIPWTDSVTVIVHK